jgi:hypothetical protein
MVTGPQTATIESAWPSLRVADWTATRDILHMWTRIVGKIRLIHAPLMNHWLHFTLYVTPRGLTTPTVPYKSEVVDIEFDFVDHELRMDGSGRGRRTIALAPMSMAELYDRTMASLAELGIEAPISARPNEMETAIPFAGTTSTPSTTPVPPTCFWRELVAADRVFGAFRSRFVGKVSLAHYFWGSLELACTRFSGRAAPPHPGAAPNRPDRVMVEGYSQEQPNCGFWPGGGEKGAFDACAASPEPVVSPTSPSPRPMPSIALGTGSSCCPTRRYGHCPPRSGAGPRSTDHLRGRVRAGGMGPLHAEADPLRWSNLQSAPNRNASPSRRDLEREELQVQLDIRRTSE